MLTHGQLCAHMLGCVDSMPPKHTHTHTRKGKIPMSKHQHTNNTQNTCSTSRRSQKLACSFNCNPGVLGEGLNLPKRPKLPGSGATILVSLWGKSEKKVSHIGANPFLQRCKGFFPVSCPGGSKNFAPLLGNFWRGQQRRPGFDSRPIVIGAGHLHHNVMPMPHT